MSENKNFKCGFCGIGHNYIKDRMICEKKCYDESLKQKKLQENEKMAKDKQSRIDEIHLIAKAYQEKVTSFYRDYGTVHPLQVLSDAHMIRNIFDVFRF